MTYSIYSWRSMMSVIILLFLITGCKKFIAVDPPRTDLLRSVVFESDETANAAGLDMYYQLQSSGFGSGDFKSVATLCELSSDNLISGLAGEHQQFSDNQLLEENTIILDLWNKIYKTIYRSNAVIEGAKSTSLTAATRNQIEGEALFFRAFSNFYLINLFGDVPLVLTTDYQTNQNIGKTSTDSIYAQIMKDLSDAEALLADDFSHASGQRIRVNKKAVTALQARVYLYKGQWSLAEAEASSIIADSTTYRTIALEDVFKANSEEAILQLYPQYGNALEEGSSHSYGHHLTEQMIDAFERDDLRGSVWIITNTFNDYVPNKYKSTNSSYTEYSMVLRLAEQYLIRAEARAQLDDIEGALEDINVIRKRAGLNDLVITDRQEMLDAINQERRVELFAEWGHRWLDLKRTGLINDVLSIVKPGWEPTAALYPIPRTQLLNDPAMKDAQNPGY